MCCSLAVLFRLDGEVKDGDGAGGKQSMPIGISRSDPLKKRSEVTGTLLEQECTEALEVYQLINRLVFVRADPVDD